MRRAAGIIVLLGIFLAVAVGAVAAAPALQAGALLPAIIDFHADLTSVSYADVEAGTAQVTLSWHIVNTDDRYRVNLDTYHQNFWASLLAEGETLPFVGSKQIPVALPENFGVPTYRLTLRNPSGEVVEQQFVTIPYTAAAEAAPSIANFSTQVQGVDTNLLVQSNARLAVSWQIQNRQPNTVILFEQVLPDGTTVRADLPRRVLWVPSSGQGAVAPRSTSLKENLVFRLSLINPIDGTVYDSAELSVPVIGNVVIAPQQVNSGGGSGTFFAASTQTITPGGEVVLNWDAGDAESVVVRQSSETGPTTLYIELPPAGSITVPVGESGEGVTFTMRAYSAEGAVTTGEVTVAPEGGG